MLPKTRIIPVGLVGARLIPTYGSGAEPSEESPTPFYFNYPTSTFTPGMAKRATTPFAASPVIQGTRDGSGVPDLLSLSRGTAAIAGLYFYPNFDPNQGSFTLFWTPEYSSGGIATNYHYFLYASSTFFFAYDYTNSWYYIKIGNQTLTVAAAVTAGTKVTLCFSWDCKNKIDGTNHARVSINDAHTFGITTVPTLAAPDSALYIGSNGALFGNCGLEQGITLSRRVLWDGSYGVNVGNGDELALIYAAGAGADPCTITGSWDVCLCVPTNSTVGALTTGTGEAWSHPHSSNLLTDGWLQSYYGGEPWAVKFNGTSTKIDCGSGATLDDLPNGAVMQVEGWVRHDGTTTQVIISKGGVSTATGWSFYVDATGYPIILVDLATTNATATHTTTIEDGKWHHVLAHYNDATRIAQVAVDGIWGAAGGAGTGAYVTDAALNVNIGMATSGTAYYWTGAIGWINIYNNSFYTPGTNFKPPRTPTAPDVEQWLLNEGTGVTATAQVTSPANDGTITVGTWQPQWYAEGTPIVPTSVDFNATTTSINCGSDAGLDDLADNAFTAEAWICCDGPGENFGGRIFDKAGGWILYVDTVAIYGVVYCATTAAAATYANATVRKDSRWHHVAMTWDDAGDRKVYFWLDGVNVMTSAAGVGAIVADAANSLYIGNRAADDRTFDGRMGWCRISNSVRYVAPFAPASRSNPPAPDANTLAQWNMTEGFGTAIDNTGTIGAAADGTLANGTWINTGAMDVDSPGGRVFGWGDAVGSDAVSEGKKITYTGLTAGANYVLRALAYSEDGVGIPRVEVYDETNAAAITAITGLATSTEWAPDVLLFSFELPTNARGAAADCTSISIKRISTTAGNVGWHQIELYTNLLDNPSLDTGAVADPWIPYGWTNNGMDAGDTEIETVIRHSEGACLQANVGAAGESIDFSIAPTVGKFYTMGGWFYNSASVNKSRFGDSLSGSKLVRQDNPTYSQIYLTIGAIWTHAAWVMRNRITPVPLSCYADAAGPNERYWDDLYVFALDDVTLTVTPASAANSLEGTGIRADGYDLLSTPTAGEMAYNWWYAEVFITPRHSDATVGLFGIATPCWIEFRYNAANTLLLDWSASNTLRLRVITGGVTYTGTWATGGGAVLAGTKYLIKIEQYYGEYRVYVGGVQRITIPGVPAFPFVPNIAYWGMDNARAYNSDIVVSSY